MNNYTKCLFADSIATPKNFECLNPKKTIEFHLPFLNLQIPAARSQMKTAQYRSGENWGGLCF